MDGQHPQSQLMGQIGHIGAVYAAGDAQHTVVVAALGVFLHHGHGFLQFFLAFAGVIAAQFPVVHVLLASRAHAVFIKFDPRVRTVHHAPGADLFRHRKHSLILSNGI